MIQGVKVKELKVIPDERGRLMEMLRVDDEIFAGFGQVYLTTTNPGVVKAWHLHKQQTDNVVCVAGMIRLGLYDDRKDSPTFGMVNQFFMGVHKPLLVQIPAFVYHGWKCVSQEEALIVNTVTKPYNPENPDEFRLDPHDNHIPLNWERKDG
ncbi:dTDP-4-dehydrorhamnose 3,5-epimerase family protein [Dethiosulfatarculus sandiegensis]|uniref:dTDP-4-dehydrorhamnose 3,5-epimerase n=1 Tax=Dethiosulfatarculus sandiegensis TaxID=1429043 RepID=A0A0D2GMF3_9BACT|nr:dTDP-4-dehydrorhamnose 3,5-epimerase [Dethiosulfatarculus sandiegensis]